MYLLSFFLLVLRKWLKGRWRFGVQREVVHGAAALALTVAAGATDIVVRCSGYGWNTVFEKPDLVGF